MIREAKRRSHVKQTRQQLCFTCIKAKLFIVWHENPLHLMHLCELLIFGQCLYSAALQFNSMYPWRYLSDSMQMLNDKHPSSVQKLSWNFCAFPTPVFSKLGSQETMSEADYFLHRWSTQRDNNTRSSTHLWENLRQHLKRAFWTGGVPRERPRSRTCKLKTEKIQTGRTLTVRQNCSPILYHAIVKDI